MDIMPALAGFIETRKRCKAELVRLGVDFDSLKDPWDMGYQLFFGVNRTQLTGDSHQCRT